MAKKKLSTIINIIKYPFLGLVFIIYSIIKFIYDFIKYILKGILFILYKFIKPFINLYKLLNKKGSSREKKSSDGKLINSKKEQKLIRKNIKQEKSMLKKQLREEKRKAEIEKKEKIYQEKIDKKKELQKQKAIKKQKQLEKKQNSKGYQRKIQKQEAKRLKKEKKEQLKREKIENKAALKLQKKQEKQKIKQEKIDKKKELQENRKIQIQLKKKAKEEAKLLAIQEKKQKRKTLIEEKQKIKQEKIDKKKELQEQKKKLKEEQKQKKEQQRLEKKQNSKAYQRKIQKQEAKRLEREKKEQLKREKLENKATLELQKEQEKEQKLIKRLQEKEERKLEKERVKQAKKELKEQRKQLPFNKRVLTFLKVIPTIPSLILKKISNWFNNLSFIKNARNKRDINRQALLLEFEGKDAEKNSTKIVYVYEAKNPDGKIVKERFAAYSKVEVHSFLLSEGYEVYSIKTNPFIQFLYKENGTTKFKTKDLVFFLTQLSTYLKAGIPLVDALKILSRQYKKRVYKDIFRTMIYDLSTGESFSSAMTKQGTTFPRLLINMVKAAELTGELTEALDDMADYYTETEKTKKQMVNAMMYPTIVFIVAIVVVIFILVFVIPQFVQMYESLDPSQIPAFTRAVIAASDFIKNNFLFIFMGIIVFIIIFIILYKKTTTFRTIVQWILMHLPVIGNVIIYNEVTLFTKTFASLLSHNVYITDSMEILNKITNNEIYKMLILDTVTNLAKGEKISLAFKDNWAFPIPAYEMLVTGESTGQLAEMMQKVSVYYQDLHKDIVTKIKTFLEPMILIFLTVVVGIIVLAIVIPMFNLYQAIQQI